MTLPIAELITQAKAIRVEVAQTFGDLSLQQLNWKAEDKKWSIAQCLDHLIVTNELYFKILRAVADGTYQGSWWARINPFAGRIGKMMINSLGPELKQTMQSPPSFRPQASDLPADMVARFDQHQGELLGLLEGFAATGVPQLNVVSPASGMITFPLADALTVIIVHEQRHLQQAKQVLAQQGLVA